LAEVSTVSKNSCISTRREWKSGPQYETPLGEPDSIYVQRNIARIFSSAAPGAKSETGKAASPAVRI